MPLVWTWLACAPDPVPLDTDRGTGAPTTGDTAAVAATWQDVGPILEARCVTCHRDGEIAPMPLDTFEAAAPWAARIAQVTRDRLMPPYLVDPTGACGEYTDPGWLTDEELATLDAWADAGAPAGGSTAPLVAAPVDHLDAPDALLDMGVAFTPTEPPDQYRCFLADPGLTSDRFMTAYEVVPGDPSMVHHVSLFTLDTEQAQRQAEALDAADEPPGYPCFGGAGVNPHDSRQVGGWAVGTPTTRLPDGTGLRLYAGRSVVVSMHYHTEAAPGADRTVVRLALEDRVPTEAFVLRPYDATMRLPPGERATAYSFRADLEGLTGVPGLAGATLYGVFPHMHERGTSMRLELDRGGSTDCLADVPRWDFNWQRTYFYREPLRMDAADELVLSCTYDTSGDTEPVPFGESTDDEMCVFGILATP